MKVLSIFLSLCLFQPCFSQKNDTTWWPQPRIPRSVTKFNNGIVDINCWHPNGTLMSSGKFRINGAYLPVSDVLVVDSNGKKVQEYIVERGLLINYMADGSVKDSLHSPLKEAKQNFVEYYTSRVIKKQWNSRKDTGRNGIVFYPFSNNEPRLSFMYQQTGFAHYLDEEFYPSGSIYKRMVYDPKIVYRHTWFTPEGEVDTSSYMGAKETGHQMIKQGQRLEWWNNGSLKSEKNYKNDYEEGPQRSWYENGRPESERFIKDGSADSITRVWYPDGKLKYYADGRFKIERKPAISFHPNGSVERMDMDITCTYDADGDLLVEYFGFGDYARHFDSRNGQPNSNRYEGRFDKMRTGEWKAYDAKGRLMYVTFYKNGLTEGETMIYDTLNRLRSRISYHQGRMHGSYILFHQNGKDTVSYGSHNMGRRWGIWKQFFQNGRLESIVKYGDRSYDELLKYNDKGELTLETIYDRKKKLETKNYYQDKKLYASYVKHLDKNRTDSYEYFPNGKPKRFIIYQRDGSQGEKSWFENGKPEMTGQRKDNVAFGKFITWWPNGNKRYEGMMRKGIRDGEWIYYNEDGSIASHPYFENGVEVVLRPQNASCFCNKTYPPLKTSFMNSAATFMPLKDINRIMQRFQLDTGYNYAFVGCNFCHPVPIYFFRDIVLKVGKDGMHLNLTPCRQGHNYGIIEVNPGYTRITNEYHDYNHDSDLLVPPVFAEALARTIGILDSWNDPFVYSEAIGEMSGDAELFQKFLEANYGVHFSEKINSGETEQEALSKAEELYAEKHKDSRVSFEKDFAQKLSVLLLKLFPDQAAILKKKPTDREAINHIIGYFFGAEMDRLGPLVYGALSATIDSGTVSLVMPTKIIAAYDKGKNKTVMKNGKPVAASFQLSFRQATYQSYPNDNLLILPEYSFNHCAQEFAIGKKGAWMRPLDFHFDFQHHRENAYYAAFDPFDYPFHYKQPESKISDMPGEIRTDDYITNFMGVVIKNGELHLPGIAIPVIASDMLLDGIELNGHIRLAKKEMDFTQEELEKAMISAGFKIMPGESEDPEETVLFFNYK